MKKLCSVICAASVALSLAVPAFATEQTSILGSTPGEVAVVEELLKNPEATPAPSETTPGEVETNEEAGNTTEITESVEINETNFPDPLFRQHIANEIDKDKDGVLSPEEIAGVTSINVSYYEDSSDSDDKFKELKSVKGIEFFTNLQNLYCGGTQISELDVSNNPNLTSLVFAETLVSKLNVSKNVNLQTLNCSNTQISELDLSKNVNLQDLYCSNTQISELDLSNNPNLTGLHCGNTQISELDLSNNPSLIILDCANTRISELDSIKNIDWISLTCYGTLITEFDLDIENNENYDWVIYQDFLAITLKGDGGDGNSWRFPNISYLMYGSDVRATYTVEGDTFSIKEKAPMFDAANVSEMQVSNGATWNPETGAIENIQNGRTEVSYQYVTGGTWEGEPIVATLGFILERDGAPTPTATPAPTAQPTATPAPSAQPTATPAPTGAPVPTATPVPGTPGEVVGSKADQLLKDPSNTQLANEIVTQINYERYMNVTSKVANAVANAIRYNPMSLGASKDGIQFGATLHKDNSGFVLVPESAAIEGDRAQVSLHFEDGKGNVVQPKLGGLVTVKIAGKTMPAGDYVLVGEGNRMIDSVTVTTVGNDTVISFWAPHFSTYAIVPRSAYVAPSDNNNGGSTAGNPIKATGLDMSMALMGVVAMAGVAVVGGAAVAKKAKKD